METTPLVLSRDMGNADNALVYIPQVSDLMGGEKAGWSPMDVFDFLKNHPDTELQLP